MLTQDVVNTELLNVGALPLGHPVLRGIVLVVEAVRIPSQSLEPRHPIIHLHIQQERFQLSGLQLVKDGRVIRNLVERLRFARVRPNVDCAFEPIIELHFLLASC
jgi:hypothetical protein